MGKLAEYLKTEVDQMRSEDSRRNESVDEWVTAVDRLYDQLERWLKEADGGTGLLTCLRASEGTEVSEPRLGWYAVRTMRVWVGSSLGDHQAVIVPKARYVAAVIHPPGREPGRADGIVQIKDRGTPEFNLFRRKTDQGDEGGPHRTGVGLRRDQGPAPAGGRVGEPEHVQGLEPRLPVRPRPAPPEGPRPAGDRLEPEPGLVPGPHLDGLARVGRPPVGDPGGEPVKATPAAARGWLPWGAGGGAPGGRT